MANVVHVLFLHKARQTALVSTKRSPADAKSWIVAGAGTLYMEVRPAGPRLRSSPSSCARDLLALGFGAAGAEAGFAPRLALLWVGPSGLGAAGACAGCEALRETTRAGQSLTLRRHRG